MRLRKDAVVSTAAAATGGSGTKRATRAATVTTTTIPITRSKTNSGNQLPLSALSQTKRTKICHDQKNDQNQLAKLRSNHNSGAEQPKSTKRVGKGNNSVRDLLNKQSNLKGNIAAGKKAEKRKIAEEIEAKDISDSESTNSKLLPVPSRSNLTTLQNSSNTAKQSPTTKTLLKSASETAAIVTTNSNLANSSNSIPDPSTSTVNKSTETTTSNSCSTSTTNYVPQYHTPVPMDPADFPKWLKGVLSLPKPAKPPALPPPPPTVFCQWQCCDWSSHNDVNALEDHLQEVHIDLQPYFDEQGRVIQWEKPTTKNEVLKRDDNDNSKTSGKDNDNTEHKDGNTSTDLNQNSIPENFQSKRATKTSPKVTRSKNRNPTTVNEQYVCLWSGCRTYGEPYSSKEWLSRHVRRFHYQQKVTTCPGQIKSLKSSSTTRKGPLDLPYKCIIDGPNREGGGCKRRFRTEAALQKHLNEDHFTPRDPLQHYRNMKLFSRQAPIPRRADKFDFFGDRAAKMALEFARQRRLAAAPGVTEVCRKVKVQEVIKRPNSCDVVLVPAPKGSKSKDLKTVYVFDERLFGPKIRMASELINSDDNSSNKNSSSSCSNKSNESNSCV